MNFKITTFGKLSFSDRFRYKKIWLRKLSGNSAYPEDGQGIILPKIYSLESSQKVGIEKKA